MNSLLKAIGIITLVSTLFSCSPQITKVISKKYPAEDIKTEILVLAVDEAIPDSAEILGTIKIGSTGFTTNCTYDVVIEAAKLEARKVGGNAIKIIKHKPPRPGESTCHRIDAEILKFDSNTYLDVNDDSTEKIDSTLNYAKLYIYRIGGKGSLVKYDLYLNDSLLCNVGNKTKELVLVRKKGSNELWAKKQSKESIPINIKYGKDYYIKCGVDMTSMTGNPKLEIANNQLGKEEYNSVRFIDYNKFRLGVDGGGCYTLGRINKNYPSNFKRHLKNLRLGYCFGADAHFFISENIGLGAKYSFYNMEQTSENFDFSDFKLKTVDERTQGTLKDDVTIYYYGPSICTRYYLDNKEGSIFWCASVGYFSYFNNGIVMDKLTLKGNTIGTAWDIGWDSELKRGLGIGIKMSYHIGKLRKAEVDDGVTIQEIEYDRGSYESVSNINLTIGLRFGK